MRSHPSLCGEGEGEWETASEDDSDEGEVEAQPSLQAIEVKGTQKRANTSEQSAPLKRTVAQVSNPSIIEHIDNSVKSSRVTSPSSGPLSSESKSSFPAAEHEKSIAVGDRVLVNSKYVRISVTSIYSQHAELLQNGV